MKIAIIGHGFVGSAVEYGFSNCEKVIIDPKYVATREQGKFGTTLYQSFFSAPDFTFICVPTPMGEDGSVDPQHIMSSLANIDHHWYGTTVVIKSTVTPSVLTEIERQYGHLKLIYNPEFLTERAAKDDFVNPPFHIIGGSDSAVIQSVIDLYKKYSLCKPCDVHTMTMQEASYTKYAINTFLATKITFFNQLKDMVDGAGYDYMKVINAVASDERIGFSHTRVPGFDGKPGYGGACFPKDVSAMVKEGKFSLLKKVHEINVDYRKDLELDAREKQQNVVFQK